MLERRLHLDAQAHSTEPPKPGSGFPIGSGRWTFSARIPGLALFFLHVRRMAGR